MNYVILKNFGFLFPQARRDVVEYILAESRSLVQKGLYDDALALAHCAVDLHKKCAEAYRWRGLVYTAMESWDIALPAFR